MSEARVRPGKGWYWVAFGIAAAGVAVAAVLIFTIFRPLFQTTHEFTTQRPLTVELEEGDERTVYQQVRGAPQGDQEPELEARDITCSAAGMRFSDGSRFTLEQGTDEFVALLDAAAERSGTFVVRCVARDGGHYALGFGPRWGAVSFAVRLGGFFVALFGGPLLGGVLALVVFLRRRRSRERAGATGAAPPGAGAAP